MARVIIEEEEDGKGPVGIPPVTPPSDPPPILPPIGLETEGDVLFCVEGRPAWQALAATNPSTFTFNDGAYAHELLIGDVHGDGTWLKIKAGDSAPYSDFYVTYKSNADNGSDPNDNVVSMGHNAGPGGGARIPGKGANVVKWESHFLSGHPQQEFHLAWTSPLGVETRILSYEGHEDDGSTSLFIDATSINVGSGVSSSALPSLAITPTTTTIASPNQAAFGTFDNAGGNAAITLGVLDNFFSPRAQLIMTADGGAHLDSAAVGRLLDLRNGGRPSFQWDNGASQILSPDNQTQVNVSNGSIVTFVSGAPIIAVGPSSFTVVKLANFNLDNVGSNTRGDQVARILVRNSTAATALVPQQHSPSAVMTAHGWTGSADRPVSFQTQVEPDGVGAGDLTWSYSNDESNYAPVFRLSSAGGPGFYGVAPPAQQTLAASPTVEALRAAFVAFGLVTP